jgi:hypothetical protein
MAQRSPARVLDKHLDGGSSRGSSLEHHVDVGHIQMQASPHRDDHQAHAGRQASTGEIAWSGELAATLASRHQRP